MLISKCLLLQTISLNTGSLDPKVLQLVARHGGELGQRAGTSASEILFDVRATDGMAGIAQLTRALLDMHQLSMTLREASDTSLTLQGDLFYKVASAARFRPNSGGWRPWNVSVSVQFAHTEARVHALV